MISRISRRMKKRRRKINNAQSIMASGLLPTKRYYFLGEEIIKGTIKKTQCNRNVAETLKIEKYGSIFF